MLTKLIEKLNHERKNAVKNGIYHLIQIKFSYNSNRIEGSGLTYEQTAHIFDKSVLITEKNANIKLDDIFETINTKVIFKDIKKEFFNSYRPYPRL
ncbi:hypothetical protein NP05227_14860 [Helicobacter pylori]